MKISTLPINGIKCRAVTKSVLKINRAWMVHLLKTGFIIILLFNFVSVFSSCTKNEKEVLEAYELRINGKVDAAISLLENILVEDSTNAMAHFELARTLNYMSMMGSKEADLHLKKALKFDPDNVVYAYYNAKNCFLKAYISMHQEGDNTKKLVNNACQEFNSVLELNPNYPEALMYLVEFYGMLPEEMGGDKNKAEEYTQQLENMDKFYGAKARLVMLPEGTDMVKYWEKHLAENGETCKALKELGVACIFSDDIERAKEHFENAMNLNKSQNIRLLDLARFHQMKVMQNRDIADEELPKSKVYIEKYLTSEPEPIPPMKAYAIGMLAKTEMLQGNRDESQKIMEDAKALDPYFSRAFGIPSLATFEAPDKVDHHFQSYFSPY